MRRGTGRMATCWQRELGRAPRTFGQELSVVADTTISAGAGRRGAIELLRRDGFLAAVLGRFFVQSLPRAFARARPVDQKFVSGCGH
jgi:hypothetical protein